jgi:hypothetical protein
MQGSRKFRGFSVIFNNFLLKFLLKNRGVSGAIHRKQPLYSFSIVCVFDAIIIISSLYGWSSHVICLEEIWL